MKALNLAFVILCVGTSAAFAEDCTLKKYVSVEMSEGPSGLPVIPVAIGGKERKFIIHTEGVFSSISPHLADELGLTRLKMDPVIYTGKGRRLREYVTVPSLGIGGASAQYAHMMISDPPPGIDGYIGPEILKAFDLDFDFAGHSFSLFQQNHCKGRVVYWTEDYATIPFDLSVDNNHITFDVELDGKVLRAALETASPETELSEATAQSRFGLTERSPGADLTEVSGTTKYRFRFQNLTVGGLTVKRPLISIYGDAINKAVQNDYSDIMAGLAASHVAVLEKPDLWLGMNVLSKLHLYIAYKEKMLYFSGASGPGWSMKGQTAAAP